VRRAAPQTGTAAALCGLCLALVLAVLFVSALMDAATARSSGPTDRSAAGRVKSGTGFFVSRDGFLVTSAHVVTGCQSLSVWGPNGSQRPSYVVAYDRFRDVALLWMEGVSVSQPAMVTRMSLQAGEEVVTLGYGVIATQPLTPVLVAGALIGDRTARPGNRIVVIRARLHAGNSGGAVLAGDGSLVGMVVGRDEENPEFGVAIPREDIEALLSGYGIRLPKQAPAPNARDFLGAISVLIQCSSASHAPSLPNTSLAAENGAIRSSRNARSP
jgi:S1-C subfamily serine protease